MPIAPRRAVGCVVVGDSNLDALSVVVIETNTTVTGNGMTATIQDRDQTRSEELANSISHGIGLLTALVAAPFMILHTIQGGDTETVVGSSIFVVTIIRGAHGAKRSATSPA